MTRVGTSDLDVLPLNVGGNVFGWTADAPTSLAVLDAFVAADGNFIDTADSYSAWVPGHTGGESETLIGEWLQRTGRRDDVVLATKISRHPDFRGLSPATVAKAADASLQRLGVDQSTCSTPTSTTPTSRWPRSWVRSPSSSTRARSATSASRTFPRHASTSGSRSPRPTACTAPWRCSRATASSTGRTSPTACATRRDATTSRSVRAGGAGRHLDPRGLRILDALDAVADARGASVTSVALAWLRQQETVAPVASARVPARVPDLVASATLDLEEADLQLLTAASEVDA